jgi:NAD(P)-dependent dehydrogenase (short-subunit alcohol dehydrogenase family)
MGLPPNPFDLTGRVAFITGASSGLGAHAARVLARHGAVVAIAARRVEKLDALAAEIEREGGRAHRVALDVTDEASAAAAIAGTAKHLGPIRILINNAGVTKSIWFTAMTQADWRDVLSVNLDGVFRVGQAAARHMQEHRQGGSIVNIASALGIASDKKVSAYMASKAAVIHLTRAMALELARDNIRVNALAPGYFLSELTESFLTSAEGKKALEKYPMRRAADLRELDGPLLLLASDAGSYVTGSVLVADGGSHLSM